MELNLRRLTFKENYTEGQLFVDGAYFCDTLEDRTRDFNKDGDLDDPGETKVYGETAIPFGTYNVVMSYSNKFKKVMPEIQHVKGFEGIRIHAGTLPQHTLGCVLCGVYEKDGRLTKPRETIKELYPLIQDAINRKEQVKIIIQ